MDDVDRKMLILLGAEPRMHYRELARRLGVSRQAVHHRMKALIEAGVIKSFNAGISVSYLDAIPVAILGVSRTASIEKTFERLGDSEFTRRVLAAGGNYLYVIGFLRNISELDGYVDFVRRTAEMPEPTVGVFCLDDGLMPHYPVDGGGAQKVSSRELSPLDLKIIASLKDDARRPIVEIANVLGVSAKTVRRHLEGMISDGLMEFQVPSDLAAGGDMFLVMHVNLKDGADRRVVGRRLLSKYSFRDAYVRTYSNLPNLLIWVFWSDDITEIRRAAKEVGEDDPVASVMLNFAYLERLYDSWREKLLSVQKMPPKKVGTRNLPSGRRGR